jgi:hypothetical protein
MKRQPAGDALVENHAQRVEIGPKIDGSSEGLFGRHVVGSPEERTGARRPVHLVHSGFQLRNPEVEYLAVPAGRHEDVVGLQIAVNDPLGVRRTQRVEHLDDEVREPAEGETSTLLHDRRERRPVEHVDDVLVADEVDGPRLREEALDDGGVPRALVIEHLHRYPAPDRGVHPLVDLPHPASTDHPSDAVAAHLLPQQRIDAGITEGLPVGFTVAGLSGGPTALGTHEHRPGSFAVSSAGVHSQRPRAALRRPGRRGADGLSRTAPRCSPPSADPWGSRKDRRLCHARSGGPSA